MRLLFAFLLTVSLLATAAFAKDDNNEHHQGRKGGTPQRGWTMRWPLRFRGTVDHWSNGQVWVKTKDNVIVEMPQAAFCYSVDPAITFATVQPGTAVRFRVPRNQLRFLAKMPSGRNLWESYEGTWYFPDEFFKRPKREHHKKDKSQDS